jgi:hypothetical protein
MVSKSVSPGFQVEYQRMIPTLPHILEAPHTARLVRRNEEGSTQVIIDGRHVSATSLANGCVFAYNDVDAISICDRGRIEKLPSSCVFGAVPPSRDGIFCGGCKDYCQKLSYVWMPGARTAKGTIDHTLPPKADSVRIIAFASGNIPVVEIGEEPSETRVGADQHFALWVLEQGSVRELAESTVGFPHWPNWESTLAAHRLLQPANMVKGPDD